MRVDGIVTFTAFPGKYDHGGGEGHFYKPLALVHKYAQHIEFITFFDLTQKNVTC
jgi:hypothetical protein